MQILAKRKNKVVYRDGDKLVKVFDESYSKSDILNEAINQARVAETGLNIPRFREVTVIDGKSAIVSDYIEGETFSRLFERYPDDRKRLLSLFVSIQRDVHAHKHLLLTKYIDKLKMKILQTDLDASTRYDLSMRLDGMRRHTHICHGDFIPSNVIMTADGTPYIIDWSHASQGNSTADGTKSYLLFRMMGADAFAEDYLDEFLTQVAGTREYAREWIPLIAAAQLAKTTDPARREMLLKWTYEEET